jgi:hydrogenase expression/formation protein HypD
MLENGAAKVANAYSRAVSFKGNQSAQNIIAQVFTECDRQWRGIGEIPMSGWKLNEEYRAHDAENRFDVGDIQTQESTVCISGQILQGIKKPDQCPAFGKECTPLNPLGATMVSSEGACAAYYKYGNVHG